MRHTKAKQRPIKLTVGSVSLRRKVAQLSLANTDLSTMLGISPGHVSHLILGRSRPSMALAFAIQGKFRIPVSSWLEPYTPPT